MLLAVVRMVKHLKLSCYRLKYGGAGKGKLRHALNDPNVGKEIHDFGGKDRSQRSHPIAGNGASN